MLQRPFGRSDGNLGQHAGRQVRLGVLVAGALVVLASAAGAGATTGTRENLKWIPVRSSPLNYQFGETYAQETPHQDLVGRLKLDRVTRVSRVVIHGKTVTGDLLVIVGEYQNATTQPTYWTEGYAFTFGTKPSRCTFDTCGPLPKGDWGRLIHAFGTPIVDYPAKGKVAAHETVSFREAISLPSGKSARPPAPVIHSLSDIWLLPIYAAFNYYELPFPRSQLIRLSSYFGRS
jgi:hypothetical protein